MQPRVEGRAPGERPLAPVAAGIGPARLKRHHRRRREGGRLGKSDLVPGKNGEEMGGMPVVVVGRVEFGRAPVLLLRHPFQQLSPTAHAGGGQRVAPRGDFGAVIVVNTRTWAAWT